MKIVELKTHLLSTQLEQPFSFSQGQVSSRNAVLIEITTDEGLIGWGESLCHGLQPPQIAAAFIEYCFRPLLLGRDPFDVEVIWEELYNRTRPFGGGAAVNAISGVDIALWDIIGKACGKPVHKLLGGAFRTSVVPYATGFYRLAHKQYPAEAAAEAIQHMERGFRFMKLKIGFGVEIDRDYIYAVREAVGGDIKLMADANCAYNAGTARRLLLECQDAKLHFFEELLAPEDLQGYRSLRHLTPTYIAAGENIFGKIGYSQWIAQGALDILQPALCSSGGFTECKKIAALAQAWNTMLIPHVWGTGVGLAASLQFLAALPPIPLSSQPEEPLLEYDQSAHPFRAELIYHAITMTNGTVEVPMKAGIGVDVNREVIQAYSQKNM